MFARDRYLAKKGKISVVDPDPEPDDFGPFGSRSGSGSGSFYQQAKIVSKTLIPTVL
jgi:hypothetical protein